jgi:hypothetical protein
MPKNKKKKVRTVNQIIEQVPFSDRYVAEDTKPVKETHSSPEA